MKFVLTKSLRLTCILFLALSTTALSARAQGVKIQIDNLNRLESSASQSVDVALDGQLLELAKKFLNPKDPKQAQVREAISGLKGIYVKAFTFDKEGVYAPADIDSLRSQLRGPGWSRMVGIKSNKEGENVEVYLRMNGSLMNGLVVIAADPKQLAVVNMVGSIDLEKLATLGGSFGIPSLNIHIGKNKE